MKIVKRLLIFLLCIVMAGGILFLISIPRVNDHIAKHTMTELAQVPMPEQTECIERYLQPESCLATEMGCSIWERCW